MSSPNVLDQSHQTIFPLAMLEIPCRTEQLGHAILYVHVLNIKLYFLFEAWNFWVGWAHETTNQVEVA